MLVCNVISRTQKSGSMYTDTLQDVNNRTVAQQINYELMCTDILPDYEVQERKDVDNDVQMTYNGGIAVERGQDR